MTPINKDFMEPTVSKAREGLLTLTKTTLLPGISINRFANTRRRDLYFTGPWWISFSPFEALKKYAKLRNQPLSLAARTCLAIDWGWSNVDVLVEARLKVPILAWSGTPKTQTLKKDRNYTGVRWKPDRDITQLYIPGLYEADPNDSRLKIWQKAFTVHHSNIR